MVIGGVFVTSCFGILELVLPLCLGLLRRGLGTGILLGHWHFFSPTLFSAAGAALVFTPGLKFHIYWLYLGAQIIYFESYEEASPPAPHFLGMEDDLQGTWMISWPNLQA